MAVFEKEDIRNSESSVVKVRRHRDNSEINLQTASVTKEAQIVSH